MLLSLSYGPGVGEEEEDEDDDELPSPVPFGGARIRASTSSGDGSTIGPPLLVLVVLPALGLVLVGVAGVPKGEGCCCCEAKLSSISARLVSYSFTIARTPAARRLRSSSLCLLTSKSCRWMSSRRATTCSKEPLLFAFRMALASTTISLIILPDVVLPMMRSRRSLFSSSCSWGWYGVIIACVRLNYVGKGGTRGHREGGGRRKQRPVL